MSNGNEQPNKRLQEKITELVGTSPREATRRASELRCIESGQTRRDVAAYAANVDAFAAMFAAQ